MRSLGAAIAFLTRIPVPGAADFNSVNVARSAKWFPLLGLFLGSVYSLTAALLSNHLPVAATAVLIVLLDALLTGALHFDGLADTADGFGGGKNSEDALRIMRDHAIGSYGGVALALLVALKVTTISALLTQNNWLHALLFTPLLGRWSVLLLAASLPYARPSASVVGGMGKQSLVWGTVLTLVALSAATSLRPWLALGSVMIVSSAFGLYCRRRIAGITGDTLGANVQLCESIALLTFVWTPYRQ